MPLIETPSAPTVSLNVEYLHAVPIGGTYTVRSEIGRKGRAMAIADSKILNEEGTMLVRGTCFFQIPRPKEIPPSNSRS
jgi:acyl-coenzyme A thioesterase PaaI-like protein